VVAITPSWRESQHVRHVVKHIIAPYGPGINERPPIPTLEERAEERLKKRRVKDERRALRRSVDEVERTVGALAKATKKATLRMGASKSD
jgi:small subunit ribosomal protein S17